MSQLPDHVAITAEELADGDLFLVRDVSVMTSTNKDKKLAFSELVSAISTAIGGGGDSLPSQGGNSGKFLTTNGTAASWADVPTELPSMTVTENGKFLTVTADGEGGYVPFWADVLPALAEGVLTSDGESLSWEAPLPLAYDGTPIDADEGTILTTSPVGLAGGSGSFGSGWAWYINNGGSANFTHVTTPDLYAPGGSMASNVTDRQLIGADGSSVVFNWGDFASTLNSGDWTTAPPTTLHEAINRIAAAVAGLLSSTIP